jgi:hypothetical protein
MHLKAKLDLTWLLKMTIRFDSKLKNGTIKRVAAIFELYMETLRPPALWL